jgi:hypothetical protein
MKHSRCTITLLTLPPELLLCIFSYIDDLDDLRSFSRSRYHLLKLYGASKIQIRSQVLANFLPADVFDAARAAVAVVCLAKHPKSSILRSFINKSLEDLAVDDWSHLSASLTTPSAIKLHRHVKFFTNLIFESATRQAGDCGLDCSSPRLPLMPEERIRIMRSLYRYQFICTLSQVDHETCKPHNILSSRYWATHCTVWEMEELGCAHDILCQQLETQADVLGLIVEECRNFFSDAYSVSRALDPSRSWMKHCAQQARRYLMSLGLPFLYGLLTARSHMDRQMLVDRQGFDANTMVYSNGTIADVPCALPRNRLLDVKSGSVDGPNEGWRWANEDLVLKIVENEEGEEESRLRFSFDYYQDIFKAERKWEYCLWSRERLEEWGVLGTQPGHAVPEPSQA